MVFVSGWFKRQFENLGPVKQYRFRQHEKREANARTEAQAEVERHVSEFLLNGGELNPEAREFLDEEQRRAVYARREHVVDLENRLVAGGIEYWRNHLEELRLASPYNRSFQEAANELLWNQGAIENQLAGIVGANGFEVVNERIPWQIRDAVIPLLETAFQRQCDMLTVHNPSANIAGLTNLVSTAAYLDMQIGVRFYAIAKPFGVFSLTWKELSEMGRIPGCPAQVTPAPIRNLIGFFISRIRPSFLFRCLPGPFLRLRR